MPKPGAADGIVVGYQYANEYMPDRDMTVCKIIGRDESGEHGDDMPVFVIEFGDGWHHKARAEHLHPWYPM